jgi:predicted membrane protein
MGGLQRATASRDFGGAELTALMGGCKIDLSRAQIASGEAVVDVFAMWGGIELTVPEDWTVICRVVPVMGGIEDQTVPPALERQRLVITGLVFMGGIGIKNRRADTA